MTSQTIDPGPPAEEDDQPHPSQPIDPGVRLQELFAEHGDQLLIRPPTVSAFSDDFRDHDPMCLVWRKFHNERAELDAHLKLVDELYGSRRKKNGKDSRVEGGHQHKATPSDATSTTEEGDQRQPKPPCLSPILEEGDQHRPKPTDVTPPAEASPAEAPTSEKVKQSEPIRSAKEDDQHQPKQSEPAPSTEEGDRFKPKPSDATPPTEEIKLSEPTPSAKKDDQTQPKLSDKKKKKKKKNKSSHPTPSGKEAEQADPTLSDASSTTEEGDAENMEGDKMTKPRIHDNLALCTGILSTLKIPARLEIKQSTIKDAGSGLFAADDFAEGQEIFRSQPVVNWRDSTKADICDFCFADAKASMDREGRPITQDSERPQISSCGGCGVARYCSPACQRRAWNVYHKLECGLLKENRDLPGTEVILQRILLLDQDGRLPYAVFEALMELEANFHKHDKSANGDDIMKVAIEAGHRIEKRIHNFKRDLNVVWRLYCVILTNSMNIRPAERETSYGISLDLGVALMNHKCNPNAFVFFEGSQARVRSLRKIDAGEEVFVSYVDPRMGFLRRQKDLKQNHFIDCYCKKCKRERLEALEMVDRDEKRLTELFNAQERLISLTLSMGLAFFQLKQQANEDVLMTYIKAVKDVTIGIFKNGEWPDHLDPLPTVRMTLADMQKIKGKLVPAMRYALRGCLWNRNRQGPTWVQDLQLLTSILVDIGNLPKDNPIFENPEFPGPLQTMLTAGGYARELCMAASKTFSLDSMYARAIVSWGSAFMRIPKEAGFDSAQFRAIFKDGQSKLLKIADISEDRSITMPSDSEMDALLEKMDSLKIDKGKVVVMKTDQKAAKSS